VKEKIGFAGMGIMGCPMALNLLKAGYPLMVYNRSPDKKKPALEAGALGAADPLDLALWADVIILMLTGPDAVDDLLYGEKGLFVERSSLKTLINMSTVPSSYTRSLAGELAGHGIAFIDAPVSGSKKPAEDASLVILAGGNKDLADRYEPLFLSLGKKVVYCGEAGQGSEMKVAVNLLLAIMMEGLCEASNLAERNGLSLSTFLDVVQSGALHCPLFSAKGEMLKTRDYAPEFPLKHLLKDLRFALCSADTSGVPIPAGHAVYQLYRQGAGRGLGDRDFAAVKKILETQSDI